VGAGWGLGNGGAWTTDYDRATCSGKKKLSEQNDRLRLANWNRANPRGGEWDPLTHITPPPPPNIKAWTKFWFGDPTEICMPAKKKKTKTKKKALRRSIEENHVLVLCLCVLFPSSRNKNKKTRTTEAGLEAARMHGKQETQNPLTNKQYPHQDKPQRGGGVGRGVPGVYGG